METPEKTGQDSTKPTVKSDLEKKIEELKKQIRKEVEDEQKKASKDPAALEFAKFGRKVLQKIKDLDGKPETAISTKSASDLMPVTRDQVKQEFADKLGIETKGKKKETKLAQNDALTAAARAYLAYNKLTPAPKPKAPKAPKKAEAQTAA